MKFVLSAALLFTTATALGEDYYKMHLFKDAECKTVDTAAPASFAAVDDTCVGMGGASVKIKTQAGGAQTFFGVSATCPTANYTQTCKTDGSECCKFSDPDGGALIFAYKLTPSVMHKMHLFKDAECKTVDTAAPASFAEIPEGKCIGMGGASVKIKPQAEGAQTFFGVSDSCSTANYTQTCKTDESECCKFLDPDGGALIFAYKLSKVKDTVPVKAPVASTVKAPVASTVSAPVASTVSECDDVTSNCGGAGDCTCEPGRSYSVCTKCPEATDLSGATTTTAGIGVIVMLAAATATSHL